MFIAVSIPFNYNRKHVDQRQIGLLVGTWVLALAVASPVIFGINNVPGRSQRECKLENESYVLYSSVCSFFIPCPLMLLLYYGIFRGLRRWEEARKAKLRGSMQASQGLLKAADALTPPLALPGSHNTERALTHKNLQPATHMSLHSTIEGKLTHEDLHADTERKFTQGTQHLVIQDDLPYENQHPVIEHDVPNENQNPIIANDVPYENQHFVIAHDVPYENQHPVIKHEQHTYMTLHPAELTLIKLPPVQEHKLMELSLDELVQDPEPQPARGGVAPRSESTAAVTYPNVSQNQRYGRTRAKINRRERKAMRVLPVVVGAFMMCWTPFFVVHTLRAMCNTCEIPSALMSTATWLGYVNSAVNPVIYTVFNTEFRKFFKKFLPRCYCRGN